MPEGLTWKRIWYNFDLFYRELYMKEFERHKKFIEKLKYNAVDEFKRKYVLFRANSDPDGPKR